MLIKASEEARALKHSWIGPEHLLLAVLKQPSPVCEAVGPLGVTYDRLLERQRSLRFDPPLRPAEPDTPISPNPRAYEVTGWAQGFAAAHGRTPTQADWLVAIICVATVTGLVEAVGSSAADVLRVLRQHGVDVPTTDPSPFRPWRSPQRIYVSEAELDPILKLLGERHPPNSDLQWGFNWTSDEPRRAYVVAEEGIDLAGIVDTVRRLTAP